MPPRRPPRKLQLPEPAWEPKEETKPITRDTTIPGIWQTYVIGDETFVEITEDARPPVPVHDEPAHLAEEDQIIQQEYEAELEDQDGRHDADDPIEAIGRIWENARAQLVQGRLPEWIANDPEKEIVAHAQEILPHIGPEATVAYLTGALAKH